MPEMSCTHTSEPVRGCHSHDARTLDAVLATIGEVLQAFALEQCVHYLTLTNLMLSRFGRQRRDTELDAAEAQVVDPSCAIGRDWKEMTTILQNSLNHRSIFADFMRVHALQFSFVQVSVQASTSFPDEVSECSSTRCRALFQIIFAARDHVRTPRLVMRPDDFVIKLSSSGG